MTGTTAELVESATEAGLTQAEREWLRMGPFEGGVPGLVRRIRRILDVSQRGLAEALGVSQSVVARWETGRTSPRVSVVQRMLRLAGVVTSFHDEGSGEVVEPMRDDGARTRGGSRYPAHVDLEVIGWWVPRAARRMTTAAYFLHLDRSRREGRPAVQYRTSKHLRQLERAIFGTPVDHPALHQLTAEAVHLDERREARRRRVPPTAPAPPTPPAA